MEMGWSREEVWDMEQVDGGWGEARDGIWSVTNEYKKRKRKRKLP